MSSDVFIPSERPENSVWYYAARPFDGALIMVQETSGIVGKRSSFSRDNQTTATQGRLTPAGWRVRISLFIMENRMQDTFSAGMAPAEKGTAVLLGICSFLGDALVFKDV